MGTRIATLEALIGQSLVLDLEITKDRQKIRQIGAIFRDQTFSWKGVTPLAKALTDLDLFGRQAQYVIGHNLFHHDLPRLKDLAPEMRLLQLPVVDTLFLSPLAFPRNPYHRLVKDYKLVRSTMSDPLEDVRLALTLFRDQWESLLLQGTQSPDLLSFYAFCFQTARFRGFSGQGMAEILGLMGGNGIKNGSQALACFSRLAEDTVCRQAVDETRIVIDSQISRPSAAYALAWLRVAGANSVLPPWVRHQFPPVGLLLKTLRDIPCGNGDCPYCSHTHDPDAQLQRFFGFNAFRPQPLNAVGRSLQREIVLRGLQDKPLLAILPTGGGKSLCYQLPALVRHMRRGQLTVVISPLQALMKDQVDNLMKTTGTPFAAGIYGLLTPPERGEVMERVRLGDIAILYISPEQLRSRFVRRVLAQREIGCWVFDEAHCLSKWGHDFRPDYLYAARFIRELCHEQHLEVPPIACFTATAKKDVIEEITSYFQRELGQDLVLFEGGVERQNLHFNVVPVNATEKLAQTVFLVRQHLTADVSGSVIVYAATRENTRLISEYLNQKGLMAEAFHGGLESHDKRRIIDEFVAGDIPVICATNAFGMGIDKSDIRLVLHYDMPGSLENYLQEAGRAGRDMEPAHCILLFDPVDAETQFRLGAVSEINKDEIQHILRCLRRSKRNKENEVVITTQELLRDEELAMHFEKGERSNETKVRTAVSWLERAAFLERNQNLTQVFQGRPVVKNIEAAEPIMAGAKVSPFTRELWRGILHILFNTRTGTGLSADDIAEQLFPAAAQFQKLERTFGLTPAQVVIHSMHEMAAIGLLDKGMLLSAFVRCRGKKSAAKQLAQVSALEERLLHTLQEEAPDAEVGQWLDLDISRLNQRLLNDGVETNPVTLRHLVRGLTQDGKGLAGSYGSIDLQHMGRNRYRVALRRSLAAVSETAALRRSVAEKIVHLLMAKAKGDRSHGHKENVSEVLIQFSANELVAGIQEDIFLHARVQKPMAAIDRGLMFLHEHKIIVLQNGLAIFRQAMTLRLNAHDRRRQYTLGDFKPLALHYKERRLHVHVIVEYANLAMDKVARALTLVLDYFALPRLDFINKYFAHRTPMLERATSMESYRQIVESLGHPVQIGIVGSPVHSNQLVLAGPGAGKTTVVVHRCAYLLRVERVPASRILVMCFNHSAAVALRKRLLALVGQDARGVMVATYHGAALRLAGISLRELAKDQRLDDFDFNHLIREAVALLKGEMEIPGLEADEVREQLLQGFSHILVDEYQDIDHDQYELVSAIAGRTLAEGDGRLAITAVGDDDQNIYAFRGANIGFIKRFQEDYHCRTVFMVENYRSCANIIQAANQLIEPNRDRMKTAYPIRINRERKIGAAGGPWQQMDDLSQGRVQRLRVRNGRHQALAALAEIQRLKTLDPAMAWDSFAILCRTKKTVDRIRFVLEQVGVPLRLNLESHLPLHRLREVRGLLSRLESIENKIRRTSALADVLPSQPSPAAVNYWIDMLHNLHALYQLETADAELPVSFFVDWLYEAVFAMRRDKIFGNGVFLSTIHGAKGLEFDHVLIADGDWPLPGSVRQWEEERRLLYVGMTRAKETLSLMAMTERGTPLIGELEGDWLNTRDLAPPPPAPAVAKAIGHRYHMVNLGDLFLGYAGRFSINHAIHQRLADLGPGDAVQLAAHDQGIGLVTSSGDYVAQLSRQGKGKWEGTLDGIEAAKVIGMIQWSAEDSQKEYRHNLKVATWEVPLVELTCRNQKIVENSNVRN